MHCSVCDKDFDHNAEWMAKYFPDIICGDCVQDKIDAKSKLTETEMLMARIKLNE